SRTAWASPGSGLACPTLALTHTQNQWPCPIVKRSEPTDLPRLLSPMIRIQLPEPERAALTRRSARPPRATSAEVVGGEPARRGGGGARGTCHRVPNAPRPGAGHPGGRR